jgi:perosamine synthetase
MTTRIPVAEPSLTGKEKQYVLDCLDTGWISGSGKYVDAFEERFAAFTGTRYAVGVFNGTVALHLALLVLGIGNGDEVIVPDLTYVASANAVRYVGATPVFAEADPLTWTLDAADVARRVTERTRAIMPVHLYGHPADMDAIGVVAARHHLAVVEDAAEAHGATCRGRVVGSIGDIATFSFFGNKIVTMGEGGIVTTNDPELARQARLLRGQGMDPERRYWFPVVGYNYRLTNIQAAIGLAQMEQIDWLIERRIEVAGWYQDLLSDVEGLVLPTEADWATCVYWLFSPLLPAGIDRDRVMVLMAERGIETRPFFVPMHALPPYYQADGDREYPVTASLSARGLNLPSSATLTRADVERVARELKACLREAQA